MRRRRIGGVLAAFFVAAGATGALALGLLASPDNGVGGSAAGGAPQLHRIRAAMHSSPRVAEAPAVSFVTPPSGLPAAGEATASGCAPALAYLHAYAAPGFSFECPGYAEGHQAMTACVSQSSPCGVQRLIVIADPCPNAYMNEASNSWVLIGASDGPLDPYGSCG